MAFLTKPISTLFRENKTSFVGILLFSTISIWLSYNLYEGSASLYLEAENSITQLQNKRKSISGMMRFARERSIILLEMYVEPDAFERYNIRQKLISEALNFVNARKAYENTDLTPKEKQLFGEIFGIVKVTAPVQIEAAELMIADDMEKANQLLFAIALPNQTQMMHKFNDLLSLVEKETDNEIIRMKELLESNNNNILLLILLVVSGTVISFIIINLHSKQKENELRKLVIERTNDLEKAHIRTNSLVNNASDGIVSIDHKQNIVLFNPAAEKMFQYHLDEVIGKPLSILIPESSSNSHPAHVEGFSRNDSIQARMMDARPEIYGKRKNGSTFPAEVSISKSYLGNELFFTAFVRDVTEKREAEEKIRKLAMLDSLTGLYNRHHFESRLKESIKYQNRFPDQGFCLMLLDLDLFKQVNDTYGHPIGDKLLKNVANLLTKSVREVDDIGRLGGDEFAIILQGVNKHNDSIIIAEKIINEISRPHIIDEYEITIGVSIGMTFRDNLDTGVEELFKQVDNMLYESKNAGKNTYRFFTQSGSDS